MKPFWTGNLLLGKLSIPVGLVPAVAANEIRLTRLHRDCMTQLGSLQWCSHHERSVPDEEIARGYMLAPRQYLLVDEEELARLAPEDTRTIETLCAVAAESVPRALVDRSYLLSPSEAPIGRRPYELLRSALAASDGLVLLARLVVRRHEWVAQIRPEGQLLMLDKLHPVEDLAERAPLEKLMAGVTVTEQEQQLASELLRAIRPMRDRPAAHLKLQQRSRLRALIDAKIAGQPVQVAARTRGQRAAAEQLPSDDLADTLRRSLPARRPGHAKKKPRPRAAPVKR